MIYDYICRRCQHKLNDVSQSIKDKPKKRCPACGKHTLERVIYGGLYGFVKNTTVDQPADKNPQDAGHYKKSESREINRMTNSQKQRYIMEGKK